MEATRRLEIELPEDMAEAVSARVASGEFASESEVVATGLKLLDDRDADADDPELEAWLRTEVIAAYDEWKANPSGGMTLDQVNAYLDQERERRRAGG